MPQKRFKLTKTELEKLLIEFNYDVYAIAKHLNKCSNTIYRLLKEYKLFNKQKRYKDITGFIFGDITVIAKVDNTYKTRCAKWKCKCLCGNTFISTYGKLKRNKYKKCLKCTITARTGCKKFPNSIYTKYIRGALVRGLEWNIEPIQLYELFIKQEKKCALSGEPIKFADKQISHLLKTSTASLDRIDSNKGYTIDNVQWVHKDVNKMKWDLTQDRFIELCLKIGQKNVKNSRVST